LSNSVVNYHEVGVLRELSDDFSCTHPLSLMCYRGDRHEALLWGSVHPVFNLVESLYEIPEWVGSHGDVDAVRSAFCCVHVGRSC
jgi:hypothetical protein